MENIDLSIEGIITEGIGHISEQMEMLSKIVCMHVKMPEGELRKMNREMLDNQLKVLHETIDITFMGWAKHP